jgi:hypothetical protein
MAFEHVITARPDVIMTLPDGVLLNLAKPIAEFSLEHRLPGIFPEREAGALILQLSDVEPRTVAVAIGPAE